MSKVGTVLAGKYELLKVVGRGGMSTVYLAMDTHLNRNWAVKEVRKTGKSKNDEIIENSILVEANLIKRLDHPALPRIVDIIDDGTTIFIVMDFIEGESLDKILAEYGPQPEQKVIEWAMQVCDVFSYLHAQKPPIIYRDMKPANLMLKPNGNICIIDFGIAREYKEENVSDTRVLGTKGYAPPEQYSGQTDPRSDVYALGMTMHQLLTGVDPTRGEQYAPVRQWNPALSEGIEAIINKCVEPAAENRYQNCQDLLLDLQDPSKVTRGWKRMLQRRLFTFAGVAALSVLAAAAGLGLRLGAIDVNNSDYATLIGSSDAASYYRAIEIYPDRTDAYDRLIDYCKNHSDTVTNDDITKLGNKIESNAKLLDSSSPAVGKLYYDIGKLYFSDYDGSLKARAANAKNYFEVAAQSASAFDKKEIAQTYYSICKFMTAQSTTSEHSLADYTALFDEIGTAMAIVERAADNEANYDKISLYYVTLLLIGDQSRFMAGVGFDKAQALDLLESAYNRAMAITSTLSYVTELQEKIRQNYPSLVSTVEANYNEVAKRQTGGIG